MLHGDLEEVYEECLKKLGKMDELKEQLWTAFQQNMSGRSLRRCLKLHPNFEDIEAEEKALGIAEAFSDTDAAISFLVDWPAQERMARIVIARADELDGNSYQTLTTAAAALEGRNPLAAILMRRAMDQDTLDGARFQRLRHEARHIAACQSCDPRLGAASSTAIAAANTVRTTIKRFCASMASTRR